MTMWASLVGQPFELLVSDESAWRGRPLAGPVGPAPGRRVQGGPVQAGSREGGRAGAGAAESASVASCKTVRDRLHMSMTNAARLPPCRMIAVCSSRHSGWSGMMPRTRQMSAMTAPTGRWRISAAIRAAVGRRARRGSASARFPGCLSGGRGARRRRAGRLRFRIRSGGAAQQPGLECGGALQGERDARQDQRDVLGAEAATGKGRVVREAALRDRGGELPAVVDEVADQAEQTREAAAPVCARRPGGELGVWTGCGGLGRHERNKNTKARRMSRNIFQAGLDTVRTDGWWVSLNGAVRPMAALRP
jgi:hypothetical protein